jgi:D-alanyl-D-alanine carboxypeptidase
MKTKTKIIIIVAIILVSWFIEIKYQDNQNKLVVLSDRASYLTTTKTIKNKVKAGLEQMILDAEKDGVCLVVVSGFRTLKQQTELYNTAPDRSIVAIPGTSEHEQGIAVDFGGCPLVNGVRDDNGERLELRKPFGDLPEYVWLVNNAYKYGFVQSYTEENKLDTGLPAETWHWRYTN